MKPRVKFAEGSATSLDILAIPWGGLLCLALVGAATGLLRAELAIPTQQAKAAVLGPASLAQLGEHAPIALLLVLTAMLGTVTLRVIEGQERRFRLATARALTPIRGQHFGPETRTVAFAALARSVGVGLLPAQLPFRNLLRMSGTPGIAGSGVLSGVEFLVFAALLRGDGPARVVARRTTVLAATLRNLRGPAAKRGTASLASTNYRGCARLRVHLDLLSRGAMPRAVDAAPRLHAAPNYTSFPHWNAVSFGGAQ